MTVSLHLMSELGSILFSSNLFMWTKHTMFIIQFDSQICIFVCCRL